MSKHQADESSPIAIKPTKRVKDENADETDLYSDVILCQDARFEKLLQEAEKLRKEKSLLLKSLNSLQKNYENLQKEFEGLKIENKKLAYNASSLFKTAQAEINRKDKSIQVLRKEKDDILFRRSSSIRALRRSRRSVTASPRKIRTPVKSGISSDDHPRPTIDDSAHLNSRQGNSNDIECDSKENIKVFLESEIEVKHGEEEDKNRVLPGQYKEKEEGGGGVVEEQQPPVPDTMYVPPPIQGPITMYSKRLYKKVHGVSPQKVPPPTNESLKLTVRDLPKDLTASSLLIPDNKHLSNQNTIHAHEKSGQVKVSPKDSSADQTCLRPNDCNTTSLTSKLRSNAQEFIKLGSSLKSCKSSPPQVLTIDLRKLPKENQLSSERLVKEILNSTASKFYMSKAHTQSINSSLKNNEVLDMSKNDVIDSNTPSTKIADLAKNEFIAPKVETPASSNEMNRSVDVLHTSYHDSHKLNNRNRARVNMNLNKPVIAPVTFGRLVPHDPPTVIAKTSVCQTVSLDDQSNEPQKRKYSAASPTESILPATVEYPSSNIVDRVKKRKILDALFGESPIKSDKPDVKNLNPKSPSPTLIFPESPSLDSDNSEDLVIDTTACSVKSPPRLSEWKQNYDIERVKTNSPPKDDFEVNSITKISSKPIENNLNTSKDIDNGGNRVENQSFNSQILQNLKKTSPNFTLPDLSECFSLDVNYVHTVNKPSFIGGPENKILDVNNSKTFTDFVQPESKSHNFHSVNVTKEDISITTRFVPSPPQQSGLTHSENSILNIAVDTMDFISTLALTKVVNISPLGTPDKRHNALVTRTESPKLDLCSDYIDRASTAPNVLSSESNSHIIQVKDANEETDTSNNAMPNDSPNHFTNALKTDCLVEKHKFSDKLINDKKPQDNNSKKYTQPHNEFKRKRPVRRLGLIPTTKENKTILNSNKENVQSQPASSKSLTSNSINCSEVDTQRVSSPEKCESLTPQSMCANTKNEKIKSPNTKYIPKDKEPLCLPPILESLVNKTEHMKSEILNQKQPLNPQLPKEIQYSKAGESDLLPDKMLKNISSKSDIMADVFLKQNEQQSKKLLKADVNKSISEMEDTRIVSIPNEQEHLAQANLTKLPDKQFYPLNLKEINVAADKSNSTYSAFASKAKAQKNNDLPEYLVKLINKDTDVDAASKPVKEFNSNLKQISSKNKVKTTCEPIDLSMANNVSSLRSSYEENDLYKDKQPGKRLPIRKAATDTEKMAFKRSVSIKMAKPMPKVKFFDQLKNRTTNDDYSAQKHAVNTDEELKEMPHVARINQKIRVSTYQGKKSQHSKGLEEISPIIMNKKEISLKQKAEFKLPESELNCKIDENVAATKRSMKIGSGLGRKISRRSVSVDRVLNIKERQNLTEKQLRSKNNLHGTCNLNRTIPEFSVKKDEIKMTAPLKRVELQQHSRSTESESPDRDRISKHHSSQAGDETLISRNHSQPANKSHGQGRVTNENVSSHEPKRTPRISPERTPTARKLNELERCNSSRDFCAGKCKKSSRLSVSPDSVSVKNISRSPSDQRSGSGNRSRINHDSIEPIPDNSKRDNRAESRSPSPVKKVKFKQEYRRSQSLSPDRQMNSKHINGKILTPRSRPRKNSYHENQNIYRSSKSSSISPVRMPEIKRYNRHRSRESESPEPKIRSRNYHESRKMDRRGPTEEYRSRSRKRSRTPPHRSNSQHYRKSSPSADQRHHRYANPRNRSRNQYENFRSRSPPHSYKRSRSWHSPDVREIFQSSGSHRTHKRPFPQEVKYNASETSIEEANLHTTYLKEINELKKALAKVQGTVGKNNYQHHETEENNLGSPNSSPEKTDVEINHKGGVHSRNQSLPGSHQAKQSSRTSSPTSNVQSQNECLDINSHQLVKADRNTLLPIQKESEIISNNTVSTTSTSETTPYIPVRKIRRRTRNLGDSEMRRVATATIKKEA